MCILKMSTKIFISPLPVIHAIESHLNLVLAPKNQIFYHLFKYLPLIRDYINIKIRDNSFVIFTNIYKKRPNFKIKHT